MNRRTFCKATALTPFALATITSINDEPAAAKTAAAKKQRFFPVQGKHESAVEYEQRIREYDAG